MRFLRFVSFSEGVSYLLLLLVAMPLKYIWGIPLAVKWVGWAHGILFITLGVAVLLAMVRSALPFKTACLVGVASLLPGGPFFGDRLLRRHVEQAGLQAISVPLVADDRAHRMRRELGAAVQEFQLDEHGDAD